MSKLQKMRMGPNLRPCFENLPPHAQKTFLAILRTKDDASAWSDTQHQRIFSITREREHLQQELTRAEILGDKDSQDAMREEIAETNAKFDKVRAETCPFGTVPDLFPRTLIRVGAKAKLVDARIKPKYEKGESPAKALRRLLSTVAKLEADRRGVLHLHDSKEEIRARIERGVDEAAGVVDLSNVMSTSLGRHHRHSVGWPTVPVLEGNTVREIPNGVATLAFTFRDQLVDALFAAAMKQHRGPGLTEVERRRRLAKIDVALLQAEREEEAVIEQIEADGGTVARRFNFVDDDRMHNERRLFAILGIERAAAHDVGEFG
jgi:hypothetical protein